MNITIYGRDKCEECAKVKKRIAGADMEYKEENIDNYITPHPGWRDDNSIDIMAALLDANNDLPVIRIENEFYTCREGMIVLGL